MENSDCHWQSSPIPPLAQIAQCSYFTYYKGVYQLRLFGLLLQPSIASSLLCTATSLGVLAFTSWTYATHSPLFYDYFFGAYGVATALQQADPSTFFDTSIFNQSYTYYVFMTFIAALIGFLVYIVLQNISLALGGARDAAQDIGVTRGAERHSVELEVLERILIRIGGLGTWAAYWLIFLGVLLPFCIITARSGAGAFDTFFGIAQFGFAIVILWIGVHLHIVCLRLVLLHPRLFGGKNDLNAALYRK